MRFRRMLFGAVVSVAVAAGLGACSSSKPTNTTNNPGAGSQAPASTTPTTAPSGGGVSY